MLFYKKKNIFIYKNPIDLNDKPTEFNLLNGHINIKICTKFQFSLCLNLNWVWIENCLTVSYYMSHKNWCIKYDTQQINNNKFNHIYFNMSDFTGLKCVLQYFQLSGFVSFVSTWHRFWHVSVCRVLKSTFSYLVRNELFSQQWFQCKCI